MKIVFDARTVRPQRTGVGHYCERLLRALMEVDRENEYSVLLADERVWQGWEAPANFRALPVRADYESHPRGDLWERYSLPALLAREGADLFHGPAFRVPTRRVPCPTIVTIHDLTCWRCAADHPWRFRQYMRWVIRRSCEAASSIIAVSQATADDLREILRVPAEKIRVVPEAADGRFRPCAAPDREQLEAIHPALTRPYLLTVGTIEPRKRIEHLIRAFERVRTLRPDLPHALIIVGKVGWKAGRARRAMQESPAARSIYHLDYLAEDDLIDIYHGASLFVCASRYEGFGLPPLEAMACGIPVVTTAGGALREVVADAGEVVADADSPNRLAEAIIAVLSDPARQAALRAAGLRRAAEFSWRRTAEETVALYDSVAPPVAAGV